MDSLHALSLRKQVHTRTNFLRNFQFYKVARVKETQAYGELTNLYASQAKI